jgi:hypothetical protein
MALLIGRWFAAFIAQIAVLRWSPVDLHRLHLVLE